jgi:hypothetical protein
MWKYCYYEAKFLLNLLIVRIKCGHSLELPGNVVGMGGSRTVENLLEGKGGKKERPRIRWMLYA